MADQPTKSRRGAAKAGALRATRVEVLQKEGQALELRKAGASFDQIAQTLDYNDRAAAHKAVSRAIRRVVTEPAEELLILETERLDDLLRRAMEIMVRPHPVLYQGKVVMVEQRDRQGRVVRDENGPIMVPLDDDAVKLAALDRVLRVDESRRKFLGLDAPERREITGKDGEPIPLEFHVVAIEQKWAQVQALHALPAVATEIDAADG